MDILSIGAVLNVASSRSVEVAAQGLECPFQQSENLL